MTEVRVIGAGLAGSEAAWQLAERGFAVRLSEMKPVKMAPAHPCADFAELVCSNSLRSDQLENAVGLLKEELRRLREGGLKMVYMGLESGCDAVLERMQKGHTAAAIVAAGQKARRAGLALSVTAISGLGSRELLREHAVDTARALSAMNPEYIGLLTLMVEPGTPLERWVREGSFQVLGPAEILQETALLLDHMDSPGSVFRMNHASNYLTLKGTLNRDLPALRQQVQEGLMGHGLRPESWRAL